MIWQTAWMAPVCVGAQLALGVGLGLAPSMPLVGVLFVVYVVACWAAVWLAAEYESGIGPTSRLRRLRTIAGPVVCLVVDIALGAILLSAA